MASEFQLPEEAIRLAMEAELEASAFYRQAAQKTNDPKGKDMFTQLADFERGHYRHLERLLESGAVKFTGYEGLSFKQAKPGVPAKELAGGDRQTDIEAIKLAIKAEEKAHQAYLELAEKAGNSTVKDMFAKLAEEENLHRRILQDQFYSLSNQGLWVWGE